MYVPSKVKQSLNNQSQKEHKMKKILLTTLTTALVITSAMAGGDSKNSTAEVEPYIPELTNASTEDQTKNFYVGVGINASQISSFKYGPDTILGVTGRVGYDFHKYLGVELRSDNGVTDGDQLSLYYSYGVYLKPQYAISEALKIYAPLGYAQTKISFDNEVGFNGVSNNYTTQNGFSFGAGVEYKINSSWGLFADVMRLIDEETKKPEGNYAVKVDSFTFGGSFHF